MHFTGKGPYLLEHAVYPVTDLNVIPFRINMNVAGPVRDSLGDQHAHHLDDGRVFRSGTGNLDGLASRSLFSGKIDGCGLDGLAHAEIAIDGLQNIGPRGNNLADLHARRLADIVDTEDVQRIRHGHN